MRTDICPRELTLEVPDAISNYSCGVCEEQEGEKSKISSTLQWGPLTKRHSFRVSCGRSALLSPEALDSCSRSRRHRVELAICSAPSDSPLAGPRISATSSIFLICSSGGRTVVCFSRSVAVTYVPVSPRR